MKSMPRVRNTTGRMRKELSVFKFICSPTAQKKEVSWAIIVLRDFSQSLSSSSSLLRLFSFAFAAGLESLR